jgi:hypothetical protein
MYNIIKTFFYHEELKYVLCDASCCRTAVGVSQRAPSLSAHMAGGPLPHSWPGEGDVTTPSYWSIAGTTVASLLRGTGGF